MVRAHRKKDIVVGFGIFPEGGNNAGLIGIPDIVFPPVRHIAAFAQGGETHVRGIQVGPMGFFRQAKGENMAVL